jgi:hypothetical protein
VSRLDFTDGPAVAAWLADLGAQVADLYAAAEDATRPPGARELGRRGARRAVTEAGEKLRAALAYAGASTGEDEPPRSGPRPA